MDSNLFRPLALFLLLTLPLLSLFGGGRANASHRGIVERVSVGRAGQEGDAGSYKPDISAGGRYVVFHSTASNFSENDDNGASDIFRKDLETGDLIKVSNSHTGGSSNGPSYRPVVDDDGMHIAFDSMASNLMEDDPIGHSNVYLCNSHTGKIVLVSNNKAGNPGNGDSLYPDISDSGSAVVFISRATDLIAGDTNGAADIFIFNEDDDSVERISSSSAGTEADQASYYARCSTGCATVVFSSYAGNLVSGDTNSEGDIFTKDPVSGVTVRVSTDSNGLQANGGSSMPGISANGRYVVFQSYASNLVKNDTNDTSDIFVKNTVTNETVRVSVDWKNREANGRSRSPSISGDGRMIAFQSWANNLVKSEGFEDRAVYIHDMKNGQTSRASVPIHYSDPENRAYYPRLTYNGRFVVFESISADFIENDNNDAKDIFIANARKVIGRK